MIQDNKQEKGNSHISPFSTCWTHGIFAFICLSCCAGMIFTPLTEIPVSALLVWPTLISFSLSLICAIVLILSSLLKLHNKLAFLYLCNFCFIWALFFFAFIGLCILAKPDADLIEVTREEIIHDEKVYNADETLLGPSRLVIPLEYNEKNDDSHIHAVPNLEHLEQKHAEILEQYLNSSPRWSITQSPTFYAQLGHVEMLLRDKKNNHVGVVHVAFIPLIEGEAMPKGYTPLKPNDAFPKAFEKEEGLPDIALDLGSNYYLLLAWRGNSDLKTGKIAINSALATLDAQFSSLAKAPSVEHIEELLRGNKSVSGKTPILKLSQAPSQFGTYQAEIYANPHESGLFTLIIKEASNHNTLRVLNFHARYSNKDDELFIHEIPDDLPTWMERQAWQPSDPNQKRILPFFTIDKGKEDENFEGIVELWFTPSADNNRTEMILSKRYQLNKCDEESLYTIPKLQESLNTSRNNTPESISKPEAKPILTTDSPTHESD